MILAEKKSGSVNICFNREKCYWASSSILEVDVRNVTCILLFV